MKKFRKVLLHNLSQRSSSWRWFKKKKDLYRDMDLNKEKPFSKMKQTRDSKQAETGSHQKTAFKKTVHQSIWLTKRLENTGEYSQIIQQSISLSP